MRYLALIFALLLFAGSVVSLIFGTYKNLYITVPMMLLFIALFHKSRSGLTKSIDPLERWLTENRAQILERGSVYKSRQVTKETVLVRYLFVASFTTFSTKVPSRWYIRGNEKTGLVAAAYAIGSAICGWWGIPYGPFWTVEALVTNISGGDATTVGKFLSAPATPV